ncbi:MAG: Rid family detoxifying hydrolase [Simkaniaceae bacterium]|nr:Rid family detoxifying hydrolase [Simkaniaceae bacterium]MCF7852217.1 Rid family detoxifying hydrolase [Simkaniaceae bacterium]
MRQKIETEKAPKAIGPYSQAILAEAHSFLFVSGQLPIDPVTGELIADIQKATARVFDNIEAILSEVQLGLDAIIRLEIFMTDLKDFAVVNAECEKRFFAAYPARQTIEVSALPKGALIEISCIAQVPLK